MKNQSSKFFLLFGFFIVVSGCVKSENETYWELLSRKGGKWKIEKATIVQYAPNSSFPSNNYEESNVGEFYFYGESKFDDEKFDMSGTINLDNGNVFGNFSNIKCDALGSLFTTELGDAGMDFQITKLDKKHFNLLLPRSGGLITNPYDYSVVFECTKIK